MNENVIKFFELYNSDPELRAKIQAAEDAYPGSLEIREYVVEDVLIPIAEEMGLGFTLLDLKKYETRVQFQHSAGEGSVEGKIVERPVFWLLDRGWQNDESVFKGNGEDENNQFVDVKDIKKSEE